MRTTLKCLLIALALISINTYAQKAPIKFGKPSKDDLKAIATGQDSAAVAIILCDYGKTDYYFSPDGNIMENFTRITRIKILKKEGYNWARKELRIDKYNETIAVRAITFNVENGELLKTELENNLIFKEEVNAYWEKIKFEMPNVKEGSVIDIKYTIKRKGIKNSKWYFQYDIPTVQSHYEVYVPEFFSFKQLLKGYAEIKASKPKIIDNSGRGYKLEYQMYSGKNIPAFKEEAYLFSAENYRSSLVFDLQDYRRKNGSVQDFTKTWQGLADNLLFHDDFGMVIDNKGGIFRSEIQSIQSTSETDEEKVKAFYNFIKNSINWNRINSIYAENIEKAWREKKGTSADINLLLIAGLRKMGYQADPVLISTRSHGFVLTSQVSLRQFNYVIAAVKIDEKVVLLDATNKSLPFGTLPERCLNGQGRIITNTGGEWVDLLSNGRKEVVYKATIEITDAGLMQGHVNEEYKGYAALDKRIELDYFTSDEKYLSNYETSFTSIDLSLDSISNKKLNDKSLIIDYQFESESFFKGEEELLLFNPILCGRIHENPFRLEQRDYPIEYGLPYSITYIADIVIPKGYKIEELPQSFQIGLTNNEAVLIHSVRELDGKIQVVTSFNINKVLFFPEEYNNLKEFYNIAVKAHSEHIILNKI